MIGFKAQYLCILLYMGADISHRPAEQCGLDLDGEFLRDV